MAIKTDSMPIENMGVTLTNAYSKIDSFTVRSTGGTPENRHLSADINVHHYANSSSRADESKRPVEMQTIWVADCSPITGSLVSGSVSYMYDQIKLQAPFSGSTISDV